MKKYKLIKPLPFENSPKVGYVSYPNKNGIHYWKGNPYKPESYPLFWKKVTYEILSLRFGEKIFDFNKLKESSLKFYESEESMLNFYIENEWEINSVKNIKSGLVLKIGDFINTSFRKIDAFLLNHKGNDLWVSTDCERGYGCSFDFFHNVTHDAKEIKDHAKEIKDLIQSRCYRYDNDDISIEFKYEKIANDMIYGIGIDMTIDYANDGEFQICNYAAETGWISNKDLEKGKIKEIKKEDFSVHLKEALQDTYFLSYKDLEYGKWYATYYEGQCEYKFKHQCNEWYNANGIKVTSRGSLNCGSFHPDNGFHFFKEIEKI